MLSAGYLYPSCHTLGYGISYSCHKSNPITALDRLWGFQKVEAPRFHMKVVRSALRTGLLRLRKYSWYSFLSEAEATAGRIMSIKKNLVTPSEIEPTTFRLIAQCLNQLRHRVSLRIVVILIGISPFFPHTYSSTATLRRILLFVTNRIWLFSLQPAQIQIYGHL